MESPYSAFLNTNYSPTPEEIVEIQEFLKGPQEKVQLLREQLKPDQEKLDALLEKRKKITELMDKYTPLLTPIRRLPPDLLSEIFYHCLPEDITGVSMRHDNYPMMLTRICSSWRQLALNTPRLWTSLHIAIPASYSYAYQPRFEDDTLSDDEELPPQEDTHIQLAIQVVDARVVGIKDWLERSGALPLTISIENWDVTIAPPNPNPQAQSVPGTTSPRFTHQILSALLPSISRWKAFYCDKLTPEFSIITSLPPSSFPMLESLSFQTETIAGGESDEGGTLVNSTGVLQAPRLRTLCLCVQQALGLQGYSIRWSELRQLSLEFINQPSSVSSSTTLSILLLCRNLVALRLNVGTGAGYGMPQPPGVAESESTTIPITLPRVKSLMMFDSSHTSDYLPCLNLPNLTHLEFQFIGHFTGGAPEGATIESFSIYRFLLKSTNLQSLSIDPDAFDPSNFCNLLKACPMIKQLSLQPQSSKIGTNIQSLVSNSIRSNFFNLLSGRVVHHDVLCPDLEDLTCSYVVKVDDEVILAFVVSKQGNVGGLARLRNLSLMISAKEPSSPSIPAQFESFKIMDEVKIDIKYIAPLPEFSAKNPMADHPSAEAQWFFDRVDVCTA